MTMSMSMTVTKPFIQYRRRQKSSDEVTHEHKQWIRQMSGLLLRPENLGVLTYADILAPDFFSIDALMGLL